MGRRSSHTWTCGGGGAGMCHPGSSPTLKCSVTATTMTNEAALLPPVAPQPQPFTSREEVSWSRRQALEGAPRHPQGHTTAGVASKIRPGRGHRRRHRRQFKAMRPPQAANGEGHHTWVEKEVTHWHNSRAAADHLAAKHRCPFLRRCGRRWAPHRFKVGSPPLGFRSQA